MGKLWIAGVLRVFMIGASLTIWGRWQTPESMAANAETKAEDEIPEFFPASEPVKDGDLEYQVVASPVWPMPGTDKNGVSIVQIQLRATNCGKDNTLFQPCVGFPYLKKGNDEWVRPKWYGNDHLRIPPTPISIAPGGSATAKLPFKLHDFSNGSLFAQNGICLCWEDHSGGYMGLEKLQQRRYALELHYKKLGSQELLREIETKPITVEIRELKASAPVIKDNFEIYALADATWPVPGEGTTSRIALGFRVINRQSHSALMMPNIAAMKIRSADGTDLPVKKSPGKISHPFPELLNMWYDTSNTFAEPALLRQSGGGLELTWSDVVGNVWKIEDLRPGKYQVRYVVQGYLWPAKEALDYVNQVRSGIAPARLPPFTGEMETASVDIEIRK